MRGNSKPFDPEDASPAAMPVNGIFQGSGLGRLVASPGNPPRRPLEVTDHTASVGRPPQEDVPWHGVATVGNEPRTPVTPDTELHGNPGAPVWA